MQFSASVSRPSLACKSLGASNDDHNTTRQMNFKPTLNRPLANAYFGTLAFLHRDMQTPQNAKEPKFSSRTANAHVLSTGSVLTYKFPKTRQQKNKKTKAGASPPDLCFLTTDNNFKPYIYNMKKIFTSFILLASSVCFSQTNTLQVIGSAGNTATNANTQLNWTIGEPITNTTTNPNNILTQGFNQSVLLITAIDEKQNSNITISPNPTADFVTINIDENDLKNSQYLLHDINGKLILQNKITDKQTKLSFIELTKATYFVVVSTNNQKTKTFKIIKN